MYLLQLFEYCKAVLYLFFYGKDSTEVFHTVDDPVVSWFLERRNVADAVVESTLTTRTGREFKILEHPNTRLTNLVDGCYELSTYRGKVCLVKDGVTVAVIEASRFAPKSPHVLHVGDSFGAASIKSFTPNGTLRNSTNALKSLIKAVDSQKPECIIVITTKKEGVDGDR